MNLQSKQVNWILPLSLHFIYNTYQYADNKGFCEDLTEGKFSFPIIHSIRSDPNSRQLLNILKQKSDSVELKQFALQLLEKTNTFAYCRQFLAVLEKEARKEIESLGGNKTLEKIMNVLSIKVEEGDVDVSLSYK